ncbi:hypothetical protein [Bradyrhizobium sp. STM 3557]|uniref:hypothetical protein n=1 Tax=Bradyrhizobium sp. STM 3557 TaxID=578920 RepID=UPI00388E3439
MASLLKNKGAPGRDAHDRAIAGDAPRFSWPFDAGGEQADVSDHSWRRIRSIDVGPGSQGHFASAARAWPVADFVSSFTTGDDLQRISQRELRTLQACLFRAPQPWRPQPLA